MMKMHKIRGVDKEICTAEQKIAYNYVLCTVMLWKGFVTQIRQHWQKMSHISKL